MSTFGLVPKLAVELCFGRMEDRNEFQQVNIFYVFIFSYSVNFVGKVNFSSEVIKIQPGVQSQTVVSLS